jgi:hypothetical protein
MTRPLKLNRSAAEATLAGWRRLIWLLPGMLGCLGLANPAMASLPADWQHFQKVEVATSGLMKISLPITTLDAARPALEDLRLYDDAGHELPYFIEPPQPASQRWQAPKSFSVSLDSAASTLKLETGTTQALDGISIETPAAGFIKAVRLEGSIDGRDWQTIENGAPIFRLPTGAERLLLPLPAKVWTALRLTLDDRRAGPIPITGARLHCVSGEAFPLEQQEVGVSERTESSGETRLTLDLGSAHLDVSEVGLVTEEPLFTRTVTLAAPQVSESAIREQIVGQGIIYRVNLDNQPLSAQLSVPLERVLSARELIVHIRNEDSPPLAIKSAYIKRRPVYLAFLARHPGKLYLLTGNAACAAPHYDLAGLGVNWNTAIPLSAAVSSVTDNPAFHAPEAWAGISALGAPLDVAGWYYRKPVSITKSGVQQLELDAEVLAATAGELASLRLVQGSNQVPYLVEHSSLTRALAPVVNEVADDKNPHLSRWQLKLPRAGLPLTRMCCQAPAALFQRSLTVYEQAQGERGEIYPRILGQAVWTQTPPLHAREFALTLQASPQTDTVYLETDNGDNPALPLDQFAFDYPVTRLVFKANPGGELGLYYGNPRASAPNYDLGLAAGELLAAAKVSATLEVGQALKPVPHRTPAAGSGSLIFWLILAGVIAGLLTVMGRLLPPKS